jgi:putative Mg2+ transporter-C (MgtC) family protein
MINHIYDPLQFSILLKLVIAMILGALIGIEREIAQKPAGLRTHMLVTGAATLLVSLSIPMLDFFNEAFGNAPLGADPTRIIQAVITGVSFLGAGTIIRGNEGSNVEGLTTAASLLFASGIGIGVALSRWAVVVGGSILVLIILRVVPYIEEKIRRRI